MEIKDTYKTISTATNEVLFKDKNSKFFGYAFPVFSEEDIKKHIKALKKQHHAAGHWCYAWQLGMSKPYRFRANDDGEPSNSAGMPIYGQLQSFDVTNTLVVVVRYFGGVKLGVGGLITAYRITAKLALQEATIVEKTINELLYITFDYKNMNKVMRIIKERKLVIINQQLELNCKLTIEVRKKDARIVFELFDKLHEINIKK